MRRRCTDHLEREVFFEYPPARIVSLCPSLTETLFFFGLDDRIVGRTVYCIHPSDRAAAALTVGGTKNVDLDAVVRLEPDLVIAEKEENTADAVEALAKSCPVYVVDVCSYEDALKTIEDLGDVTDRKEQALGLVADIKGAFAGLGPVRPRTVVYLIWRRPYMAAGGGTYINSLLEMCGLRNLCATLPLRYPELSVEGLEELAPDVVMLSSEPFPFDRSHVEELSELLPEARPLLVDGEMFGWYGSRMLRVPAYLADVSRRLG